MTKPLFQLEGVAAGYPGQPVLRGVDLSLAPGERLALLGDNGAGKSTLLLAMTGFVPVTAGRLTAFGALRHSEADFRAVRARAGLVFQESEDQLFCPTVLEDVAFGPRNLGHSRAEALAIAQATLQRLGLDDLAPRISQNLSGGQKRLVALATVLAMAPEVLLLDEPTTGLDAAAHARLCCLLETLPQAMVIASHDMDFVARFATSAVLLKDGRSHAATLHVHEFKRRQAHLHFPDETTSPAGHSHRYDMVSPKPRN